jgi:hypothetical protein
MDVYDFFIFSFLSHQLHLSYILHFLTNYTNFIYLANRIYKLGIIRKYKYTLKAEMKPLVSVMLNYVCCTVI